MKTTIHCNGTGSNDSAEALEQTQILQKSKEGLSAGITANDRNDKLACCRICESNAERFATSDNILRKYIANYYRCPNCDFIFIADPFWLPEAYATALAKADTGALHRNVTTASVTCCVLRLLRPRSKLFLDFGGGHGVLVRMMRDLGFDFHWSDAFAENLFARGFEQQPGCKYDLVTAFEVLEHLANPLDEISKMMALADDVLVSTEILSDPPQKPGDWWYYAISTGQHISFYSKKTLNVIARKFDRHVVSAGAIHFFSKSPISSLTFNVIANARLARITKLAARRRSLVQADFERFTT